MDVVALQAAKADAKKTYAATAGLSNGTDDRAAIQVLLNAARTAGRGSVRGLPGQTYLLGAPLIVGTGTTLDMTGCKVALTVGANSNLLRNYADVNPLGSAADASMTTGSNVVTTALAATAAVGQTLVVAGAGGNGNGPLVGNVTAATATTVTLTTLDGRPANATATVSAAAVTVFGRDVGIQIIGGVWDRGANAGAAIRNYGLCLRHVDKLVVDIEGYTATANGKFAIAVGDVSRYRISARGLDNTSDGVHIDGPAYMGEIPRVIGGTGDDLLAFTCANYSANQDVAGDIIDCVVGEVRSTATAAYANGNAFRVVAGAGRIADRIYAGSVGGTPRQYLVKLGDDTAQPSTTGGTYGDIDVGKVLPGAGYDQTPVLVNSGTYTRVRASITDTPAAANRGSIVVGGPNPTSVGVLDLYDCNVAGTCRGMVFGSAGYPAAVTIEHLLIQRPRFRPSIGGALVYLDVPNTITKLSILEPNALWTVTGGGLLELIGGTVKSASIRGGTVTLPAGLTQSVLVTSGTLTDLEYATDTTFASTASGFVVYQSGIGGGSLLRTRMGRCVITNGAAVVRLANAGTVFYDGLTVVATGRLGQFYANTTAVLAAVQWDRAANTSLAAFVITTGPLLVSGSGLNVVGAFTLLQRAAAEAVRVNSPTLPVDVSALTPADGDLAFNTNAALLCGTGPAVYQATAAKWKGLYSGVTN